MIGSARTININCEFSDIENCVRNCYQCNVHKLIITKPNQTVEAINGVHLNSEDSNDNVVTLKIIEQVMAFVPAGLSQHFPYTSVLRIWSSELRSLTQVDIRELKYLTDLSLSGNHLETLSSNLFEFNRRLIKIDFSRNRIKHVGTNFFKPLRNLLIVDFYQNECINDGARYSFELLKSQLRGRCQPSNDMLVAEVDSLSNEIEILEREIEMRDKIVKVCSGERDAYAKLNALFPEISADEWDEEDDEWRD